MGSLYMRGPPSHVQTAENLLRLAPRQDALLLPLKFLLGQIGLAGLFRLIGA